MNKLFVFLVATSACICALAQERQFLAKADVEALASGKKWNHVRAQDKQAVRWDLRSGGSLFANNLTTRQSDSGSWSTNDQGQLCVKWRGKSQDRCVAVAKVGEKLQMVDSADLQGAYAELTVE